MLIAAGMADGKEKARDRDNRDPNGNANEQ
jgi:hypothetical protein